MRGAAARQLPLDLPHEISFHRDDFLESPANAEALALVERWPEWSSHGAAIIGPHGSGKSHLAAIWAERAGARVLPLRMLNKVEAASVLSTGAAVLENLVANEYDEAALFHLLNIAREDKAHVLITSGRSLDHGAALLPDLASRLRALPKATLAAPGEELIAAVLVKLFSDRQIAIEPDLIGYLLPRMERSLGGARKLVEAFDKAALAAGRPVNKAFAASYFARNGHLSF